MFLSFTASNSAFACFSADLQFNVAKMQGMPYHIVEILETENDLMYEYICFDLDGTLTQSEFGVVGAVEYALNMMGIEEPDKKKLLRFIGPPLYVSFDEYYGLKGDDLEKAIEYFRSMYDTKGYMESPLYDGIEDVLGKLKAAGRHILIVTSKPIGMANKVADNTGLDKYIEKIIGPDGEMKDASKAALLRKASEYAGSDLSRMIMIGDRLYDIEGANEVGTDSIGVIYGYGSREELTLAGATYLADTPTDILKYTL